MSCVECSKDLYGRLVDTDGDFSHITRKKKWYEFILLGLAVCGIDYCYAAETALVSPLLLEIGVPVSYMTMIWCISPSLGLFFVPILGSCSDRCSSKIGRRKPFIILGYVGIIIGLILVPNGQDIGLLFGDVYENQESDAVSTAWFWPNKASALGGLHRLQDNNSYTILNSDRVNSTDDYLHHTWGIVFTTLGLVLLDFNCDSCQSPTRSFLLDQTVPEDHPKGLAIVTVMGGVGGTIGYIMGGIDWGGNANGSLILHARIVFTIVLFVCVICVMTTVFSMKEMPLEKLRNLNATQSKTHIGQDGGDSEDQTATFSEQAISYGAIVENDKSASNGISPNPDCAHSLRDTPMQLDEYAGVEEGVTLKTYLVSIIQMPKALVILCLTNFLGYMALLCYALFFTDFVGQTIYGGNPAAELGTKSRSLYNQGVMVGSLSMALMSFGTCAYALLMEKMIWKFGAKMVYLLGQLAFCLGCVLMAVIHHPAILVFSLTAGIMYSTLFNMPYLLVARYHANGTEFKDGKAPLDPVKSVRGMGTDVAVITAMVFPAQIILTLCMGSIINAIGSTIVIMAAAAILAFLAAIMSAQVVYQDM